MAQYYPLTSVHFLVHKISRHRNYVFTYNNPQETWIPEEVFGSTERIRFLAGQYEIGGQGHNRHFQGYVQFQHSVGMATAKLLLGGSSIHLEPRRGTHQEALDYVIKGETRAEGQLPQIYGEAVDNQGQWSDLETARELVCSGGLLAVAEEQFGTFLRYHRGLALYAALKAAPRSQPPRVGYYWGPSGSGKTRSVWEKEEDWSRIFPVPIAKTLWFDGYRPGYHTIILLDDYYHNWPVTTLLRLLDRYPMILPTKGSHALISNCDIYITSNIALESQYPNYPDPDALRRRFSEVIHFNNAL